VELLAARVEQGVVSAVHDALGTDVHPAARGHLSVVGYADGSGPAEVVRVVEHADHKAVGEDDARRRRMGAEESQRMSGLEDQGLVGGEDFKVFLDEEVLHPVLADLPRLAVCDELIGIQGNIEVQVVVDHDLNGAAFDAVSPILVDGLSVQGARRTEAVAVNAAVLFQLLREFPRHLFVIPGMDVAQRVFYRQRPIRLAEMRLAPRRPAIARIHGGILRQLLIQFDDHCLR